MTDNISKGESFKTRLDKTWESIYLTLISIVQGVVFSYFLYQLDSASGGFTLSNWLFSLTTFIIIVLVWHEYVTGTVAFKWSPGILDSLIPFLMGFFQCYTIYCIPREDGKWFFSMFLFLLTGTIAYINMYYKARRGNRNDIVFKALGNLVKVSCLIPFSLAALFLIFYLIIINNDCSEAIITGLSISSSIIFIFYTIMIRQFRQTLLKEG